MQYQSTLIYGTCSRLQIVGSIYLLPALLPIQLGSPINPKIDIHQPKTVIIECKQNSKIYNLYICCNMITYHQFKIGFLNCRGGEPATFKRGRGYHLMLLHFWWDSQSVLLLFEGGGAQYFSPIFKQIVVC